MSEQAPNQGTVLVDANKPTIKDEIGKVEGKLNPQKPGESPAQAARRIKIDDQEIDEDEIVKVFKERKTHQRTATKQMQEAQQLRKQNEEFVKMLKDPSKYWELAKDPRIGHDPRKLAEEYLATQLQDELMDPREKELRDVKRLLKEKEDIETRAKEEVEGKRLEALKKHYSEDFTKQIVGALETTNLPRTEHTVKKIAYYMHQTLKIGTPVTAQEAAALVKQDYIDEHKSLYSGLDGETLVSILGDDAAKKLREWDVSRLKNPTRPPEVKGAKPIENRKEPMSHQERRRFNRGY